MKRAVLLGTAMLAGLLLQGCPIFPEEPYGCDSNLDCGEGFRCNFYTGVCEEVYEPATGGQPSLNRCYSPADCGYYETCTAAGVCQAGDCTVPGNRCLDGYACELEGNRWVCLPVSSGSGGSGGAGPSSGGNAGTPPTGGAAGEPPATGGAGGDTGTAGTAPVGGAAGFPRLGAQQA